MTNAFAVQHSTLAKPHLYRLGISVGSPLFEGENFASIIAWLNCQADVKEVVIVLADTLQRHNLPEELTDFAREQMTYKAGDEWLQRNSGSFDKLKSKHTVVRWNQIKSSAKFKPLLSDLEGLYESNEPFRSALDADVNCYLQRRSRKTPLPNNAKTISRNYFMEELCCIAIMLEMFPGPEAYPGPFLACAIHLAATQKEGPFGCFANLRSMEIKLRERGR